VPLDARPTIKTLDKDRRPGPHCVHTAKEPVVVERPMEGMSIERSLARAGSQQAKNASMETPAASVTWFVFALKKKVMGASGGDCRLLPLDRPCTLIFVNLELVGSARFRFRIGE
jgi:hypothetical protein